MKVDELKDILYDNLMTKYSWGGIDKNKVYIDETNARMIRILKTFSID